MEKGDFPFKHERGRKFNVQSSNTLRAFPWVDNLRKPDLVHVYNHDDQAVTKFFARSNAVSLDKHKLWEQLEEDQHRQSEWQSIHRRFGQDPDEYDPNTNIVEQFVWPARKFVVINGNNISQSGNRSVPHINEHVKHENPNKTVSRAARKRQQQRMEAQQQHVALTLEPKQGQTCWNIQRNKPDMKMVHENQSPVQKWHKTDPKTRRLERKKDIKNLL